jgi:Lon protease-like protein
MTQLPMFPLGSVLFPHMPLSLRIFEERYVVMLSRVLQQEPSEFGVVLIERGHEVGGGLEQRFALGVVAQIVQLEAQEGSIGLIAQGGARIAVSEWLPDDPHPAAVVEELPALEWSEEDAELLARAEQVVRRALARASEFVDDIWSAETVLDDDPVARAWQLAGIAPLGSLDQIGLLRAGSVHELLSGVIESTLAAEETLLSGWSDG